ncbi:MAG: TRAM domain-containing protein, partial [Magnetococcales bacterium]|nr:TRAM domain-containing protein [Magnetococcales bacterium]NGZ29375.1 TRAM domain-containing protein [Magnetococcales bacterium]
YSFKYSARPGTPAANMEDDIPEKVRAHRLEILQTQLNAQQLADNQKQVGKVEEVLVEGMARMGDSDLTGRTPGNRKVNFAGDPSLIGRTVRVIITEGHPNSLKGKVFRPWENC